MSKYKNHGRLSVSCRGETCYCFAVLFLHHLCWYIFEKANKVHNVKRRGEKNIQNKAVQTKLNLYIKKYMKKETLQIF